jgi:anaerobic magnesium-protoporphyrin IX monomethyl ester cyclase
VVREGKSDGIGKVALVYPEVKTDLAGCNPPYALICLATCLVRDQIDARIFDIDGYGGDLHRLVDALDSFSPDIIGMPVFYNTFASIDRTLKCLQERHVDGAVVLGGPEVAADPENVLNCFPSVRFCLTGEADLSMKTFARRFLQGEEVFDIPGLAYRDGTTIHKNPPQLISDLSILPVPDHGLLKENYSRKVYWRLGERGSTAIIVSSRGCPYRCKFCFKLESHARFRGAASIQEEIDQIVSMGIRNIHFMDDLLVTNMKRVREIFDPIDPKLGIRFKVRARVDSINDEIVEYLRNKGVREIACGFESGSAKMLGLMNKRTSPEQNYEAVRIIKRHGIKVFADVFLGYPGEDRSTADETLRFIWGAKPSYVNWGIFIPFTGTPIVAELKEKGLIDGQFSLGQRPHVSYEYMSDEEYWCLVADFRRSVLRYNSSLSGVLLPSLFGLIRSSGVKQYRLMFRHLLESKFRR